MHKHKEKHSDSFRLQVSLGPAVEPLTVAAVRDEHLKAIDTTEENQKITDLIKSARLEVENHLYKKLITQTCKLYLNEFTDPIRLHCGPVQSITSVQYYDNEGQLQTADPATYEAEIYGEPAMIRPIDSWPAERSNRYNQVIITYQAGYGDAGADVPEPIRQAMLLLIARKYETREDQGVITMGRTKATDSLLRNYRTNFFI